MAEISGVVNSIIYRNAENGWTVLELTPDEGEKLTIVGTLPLASVGERVELTGDYASHPKYGGQFKATQYKTLAPATLSAIESYLGSGLIKGVGAATAKAIVAKFGMETLAVLDETPHRLCEISGIGAKRRDMIVASFIENRMMRDILLALEPYGVTVNQAYKLYKIYGELCLSRIEEDPYQIIRDVDGIGFVTADKIAQNVSGYTFDSESRLRAGILFALQTASGEYGHTYLPKDSLENYASKLLGVPGERVLESLDILIERGEAILQYVGETESVFLPYLQRMEINIADKLLTLSQKPVDNPFFDFEAAQASQKLELSAQQRGAVLAALNEGVLVITGGPGTGKTTIIRFITAIMEGMGLSVELTAPTGRAAKRMSDATGHDARTIHRLLEYIPGEGIPAGCGRSAAVRYGHCGRNLHGGRAADARAAQGRARRHPLYHGGRRGPAPFRRRGGRAAGRDRQRRNPRRASRRNLPSGAEEHDCYERAPHQRRPAAGTRSGRIPTFCFEDVPSQDRILSRILELCTRPRGVLATSDPLMDVQVLAPMKKGVLGVWNINSQLQAALNPPEKGKHEHISGDVTFREGDRVMQMKNNYRVEWRRKLPGGGYEDGLRRV